MADVEPTHDLPRRRLAFLRSRRRRRPDAAMTVMEHLGELRNRLVVSLAAFFLISVVAFFFFEPILELALRPLCSVDPDRLGPQGCKLITTSPLEGFLVRLKVTAMVGLIGASPVWLYQLWAFIVPGLTVRERRYALPFVLSSVSLFAIGTAAAYLTLPAGLNLLIQLQTGELVPFLRAEEYLNFVGLMLIAFGLTFELPLFLFFLGLVGIISVEQLRRQRKVALVSIVFLAAIVTPSQDPYTMLALAVPLYGLYELTIVLLSVVARRRARRT